MQTKIESNKQEMKSNKKYYDEKMLNFAEDLKKLLHPLWYQLTGGLHHWTVDTQRKLAVCGI